MERKPQTFENHAKFDPWFHFFLVPVLTLLFFLVVWRCFVDFNRWNVYAAILGFAVLVLAFKVRIYALHNQDRLIRLEERLRMQAILPAPLQARIGELTEDQFIGLRFASDEELPGLVRQTLENNWDRKQIKQAVKNWRPDYFRL
jgi:hypothetical protein